MVMVRRNDGYAKNILALGRVLVSPCWISLPLFLMGFSTRLASFSAYIAISHLENTKRVLENMEG